MRQVEVSRTIVFETPGGPGASSIRLISLILGLRETV